MSELSLIQSLIVGAEAATPAYAPYAALTDAVFSAIGGNLSALQSGITLNETFDGVAGTLQIGANPSATGNVPQFTANPVEGLIVSILEAVLPRYAVLIVIADAVYDVLREKANAFSQAFEIVVTVKGVKYFILWQPNP